MGISLHADPIYLYLGVDDIEEFPITLSLQVFPSNPTVFSSINSQILFSNGVSREITFNTQNNGDSQINILLSDHGHEAITTSILNATPGNSITNSDGNLIVISQLGSVNLSWSAANNFNGYKINRADNTNFLFTLAETLATNYVDTNVINGKSYSYSVSWIDANDPTNGALSTNFLFTLKVRMPLNLYKIENGLAFSARSNATYQIYYKTNLDSLFWTLYQQTNLAVNQNVVLIDNGGFFKDKIFYVREKE